MTTFILFLFILALFARVSNLNSRVNALEGNKSVKPSASETAAMVFLLAFIVLLFVLAISASVEADDWDYYYDDLPEAYEVYPTIPGTSIRDYNQPGYHIEIDRFGNERGYPTIPGTSIRDYNRPGYHIERR